MSLIFAATRGDVSAAREIRDAVGDVQKFRTPFDEPDGGIKAIVVEFVSADNERSDRDALTVVEGSALGDELPGVHKVSTASARRSDGY
jgi:hypothetical protein